MRIRKGSILATAVPRERGLPTHYEHNDKTAVTAFGFDGTVTEVHTPQTALHRVHEIMHTRHTQAGAYARDYAGVLPIVAQIVEDARLHIKHWPWPDNTTPRVIADNVREELATEMQAIKTLEHPGMAFLAQLRHRAVAIGACQDALYSGTREMIELIRNGQHAKAARMIHAAYFGDEQPIAPGDRDDMYRKGSKGWSVDGESTGALQIIELPKTQRVAAEETGYRHATSGARIIRHLLRRPVLPARIFYRHSPQEPQGTILIDASGSMGDFRFVGRVAAKAPQATVAYYAGIDNEPYNGWLYVFARDGWRATETKEPPARGNGCDGAALDWLMQQEAPRVFITDCEFTGVGAALEVERLRRLEREGEITVRQYGDDEDYESEEPCDCENCRRARGELVECRDCGCDPCEC